MMKHPILQKSHGSIPTGSCGKLSLALSSFAPCDVRGVHKSWFP